MLQHFVKGHGVVLFIMYLTNHVQRTLLV